MCIALFSTSHPEYSLIVASNRDEYLRRPTARAEWWSAPDSHVLAGRDLHASARGTWLGVTRDGRIAVLTNFREDQQGEQEGSKLVSRGAMVKAYLTQPPGKVQDTEAFARRLVSGEGARGSGGFTLVCGRLHGGPLAVVSNRMKNVGEVAWIGEGGKSNADGDDGQPAVIGLSNAAFGDRSWPKVTEGERLVEQVIREHAAKYSSSSSSSSGSNDSNPTGTTNSSSTTPANGSTDTDTSTTTTTPAETELITSLLTVLGTNTLPIRQDDEGWATYVKRLKESIFIPVVGGDDPTYYGDEIASGRSGRRMSVNQLAPGSYGTSKQTVVLVRRGKPGEPVQVTFVEKTLYEDAKPVRGDKDAVRVFRFGVEEVV